MYVLIANAHIIITLTRFVLLRLLSKQSRTACRALRRLLRAPGGRAAPATR
jgi:hypothetical protein